MFSDINFVWRSTLLDAGHIFPVLQSIALPWWFIEAAQPAQALLEQTRDSRLVSPDTNAGYGDWWAFLLIAQIVYGVLPRLISLSWANYRIHALLAEAETTEQAPETLLNPQPETPKLTSVSHPELPLSGFNLLYWHHLPDALQQKLYQQLGTPDQSFLGGAAGTVSAEQAALASQLPLVVVTAAWEPPMGELADLLESGHGYLLPLDWNSQQDWQPVSQHYLDEWRRFCDPLSGWQLIQVEALR